MSKKTPQPARQVWGLLHVESNKFVQWGTKCGWSGASGCKRAYQVHTGLRFKDQSDFVAVNLSELFFRHQEAERGEQE